MANQRPIRVPPHARRRWRRRRPQRWIEGNSAIPNNTDNCVVQGDIMQCDPDTPVRVLLDGDADWDWSDRSEVVVDRIVGTLTFRSFVEDISGGGTIQNPIMIRFGILAFEEAEGTYPTIDLFDREALEEYQWMWIEQFSTGTDQLQSNNSDGMFRIAADDRRVDIATRRKLGKKDSVVLYAQWKFMGASVTNVLTGIQVMPLLRCIIQS